MVTTTCSPCAAIARRSLSTNSSCGPSTPGTQSSGTSAPLLEEGAVDGDGSDVLAAQVGQHPTPRRALDEAQLEQVGLVDVLDRVRLLAQRDGEGRQSHRAASELVRDRPEQLAVHALQALGVDLEEIERLGSDLGCDLALVAHLGDVADATQDAVRHPRRSSGSPRDLPGGLVHDHNAENARRAVDDSGQLVGLVVPEPEGHAEAVAEGRGQQARARGRPDEREGRKVERERARRRPLAHDDVEAEVLERGVEDLFNGRREAVDLVDEEDVARLECGQDRRQVALALQGGPGDDADPHPELLLDDEGEARLAQPGRTDEENVVQRLAAAPGRLQSYLELCLDSFLSDELVQPPRTQRAVEVFISPLLNLRRDQTGRAHAAFLNASRTRSSGGSSESTWASARSASETE